MKNPEEKKTDPRPLRAEINLDVLDEYLARANAQLSQCAKDFMKEVNVELIGAETPPDNDAPETKPRPPQP